jgi:hypothetical protein
VFGGGGVQRVVGGGGTGSECAEARGARGGWVTKCAVSGLEGGGGSMALLSCTD